MASARGQGPQEEFTAALAVCRQRLARTAALAIKGRYDEGLSLEAFGDAVRTAACQAKVMPPIHFLGKHLAMKSIRPLATERLEQLFRLRTRWEHTVAL